MDKDNDEENEDFTDYTDIRGHFSDVEDLNTLKKAIFRSIGIKEREKESKLEYGLYVFIFLIYFLISFGVAAYALFFYWDGVLLPYLFDVDGFTNSWNADLGSWFAHIPQNLATFGELMSNPLRLFIFVTIPLVLIIIYLLRLFVSALVAKFFYWLLNFVKKRREMLNAPPRGKTADDVNIYHTRGLLLRMVKWSFSKSLFPWLTTWMFNFIGANDIGKGTTIEDSFYCQEYLETGKNCYIGPASIVSSHLVEGRYGQLTVKKDVMGDDCVLSAFVLTPPGLVMGNGSQILPTSLTTKFQKIDEDSSNWGVTVKELEPATLKKMLDLPDDIYQQYLKKHDLGDQK